MLRVAPAIAGGVAEPLAELILTGANGSTVSLKDGAGREYVRLAASPVVTFVVAGALGKHTADVLDDMGRVTDSVPFTVDARTNVEDGGAFGALFRLFKNGMHVYSPDGTGSVTLQGQTYQFFVPWMLDHVHTAKGMQYFSPVAADLAELSQRSQREDGMIWSVVSESDGPGYFDTAYGKWGYVRRDGRVLFVRQPAENHVEYLYVNLIFLCWKATGDEIWMAEKLDSAIRALDYSVTDPARYSQKYGLLKRAYTIDSWDFQIEDEYTPDLGVGSAMTIDVEKTKFGVFYGDNTGYCQACDELAEMLHRAGRGGEAAKFETRSREMRTRLNDVTWNGRFFTHHVEEDPHVQRHLGVDESTQVSLSNCYSVNRGLPHDQVAAIIQTYRDRKDDLPPGSPGEWYAIYPPFERGFGDHAGKWVYMNGGVAGHAAGELARGAFEHGFEDYGVDILRRLGALGAEHGNRIWFSYRGAIPPPPPPPNTMAIDLTDTANMDLRDQGGTNALTWMGETLAGNDLRRLPVGEQILANISFQITDPAQNGRRAAIGVALRPGFPTRVTVPIHQTAVSVYLLHTVSQIGPSGIASAVTFQYTDGSQATQYLQQGKHLTGWWFPTLETKHSGVAWRGTSPVSENIGICWAALPNPLPEKEIAALVFDASLEGSIYALAALTLADQPHYVPPQTITLTGQDTGGPDNWAAGTAMAGFIEGLAGVRDEDVAYRRVRIAPRWTAANVNEVDVTVRYAASQGYVRYRFTHDTTDRQITLTVTGSGEEARVHLLLPPTVTEARAVTLGGRVVPCEHTSLEGSHYADFAVALPGPQTIVVTY